MGRWEHRDEAGRGELIAELHRLTAKASLPSLREAIRLLESEQFEALTPDHIREVADYRSIELGSERFFHRAFTPGKEAAASLAFARRLGRRVVLEDLQRLRASLGRSAAESVAGARGDSEIASCGSDAQG
jgi:hypothetical protein